MANEKKKKAVYAQYDRGKVTPSKGSPGIGQDVAFMPTLWNLQERKGKSF